MTDVVLKPQKQSKIMQIFLHILQVLKSSSQDYCEIETTSGAYSLVYKNGAMATIIKYNGVTDLISDNDFNHFISYLSNESGIFLKDSGHQMGFFFSRDSGDNPELEEISRIKKSTAANLHLDMDDYIDETSNLYNDSIYAETNFIVLISQPSLLLPEEISVENKKLTENSKGIELPRLNTSQNIYKISSGLAQRHDSFVSSICATLKNNKAFEINFDLIDVVECLREIKRTIDPKNTPKEWLPRIPNLNKVPSLQRIFERPKIRTPMSYAVTVDPIDISCLSWQPISDQILSLPITGVDRDSTGVYPTNSVCVGGKVYTPVVVEIPPQIQVYFPSLFTILNSAFIKKDDGSTRAMPYTLGFMISGDGFAGVAIKRTLSQLMTFSTVNKNIYEAFKELGDFRENQGTVVKFQLSAMTWAEDTKEGRESVHVARTKLIQSLQKWGGTQIREKSGDPISGFVSCVPALSYKSHAPSCVAPLPDVLSMLPFQRPETIFEDGTSITSSVDGKLLVHSLFSPECSTWIKIYVGKPGSGKSMALNCDIIDAILLPGQKELPFIFLIDVGITSQGMINLLRDSLPHHLRHLVSYKQLVNSKKSAINIFECPVGFTTPRSHELDQIVLFLSTLLTSVEAKKPEEGLSDFLKALVRETFKYKRDDFEGGSPNRFEPDECAELTAICQTYHIDCFPEGKTLSYYQLVRIFHEKAEALGGDISTSQVADYYRGRDLAHRHAMPTIADAIEVATQGSGAIHNGYSQRMTSIGVDFCTFFAQQAREAIVSYPIFCNITNFDITSRVTSIDLQNLADKNNPKQSSLAFQIAAIYAKKQFSFSDIDIELSPPLFRSYYSRLVKRITETKKIIAMDELHNAQNDPFLFGSLDKDAREGRKWNLMLLLSSQKLGDFGDLPGNATQFVLADSGNSKSHKILRENVNVSEQAIDTLKSHVGLDRSVGLYYLSITVASTSVSTNLVLSRVGARTQWSLTTKPDDRALRDELSELLYSDRRQVSTILAHYFPHGSAERAIRNRRINSNASANGNNDSIVAKLATELVNSAINDNLITKL